MAGFDTTLRWVNLRATSGYVTDGANQYPFVNSPAASGYPTGTTVNGASVNMGIVSGTGAMETRDRSTGVDTRLAGLYFRAHSAVEQPVLRIDLPAAGNYEIHLAIGDQANPMSGYRVEILDGSTSLAVLTGSTSTGQFADTTNVVRTSPSDWVANQVGQTFAFATTTLNIKFCTGSADGGTSGLATVGIMSVPAVNYDPITACFPIGYYE